MVLDWGEKVRNEAAFLSLVLFLLLPLFLLFASNLPTCIYISPFLKGFNIAIVKGGYMRSTTVALQVDISRAR